MKERPILFSAPMVRAILEGRKTQTRRVVKLQPRNRADIGHHGAGIPFIRNPDPLRPNLFCPYGRPGDRLWVREAFTPMPTDVPPETPCETKWDIGYAAGGMRLDAVAPAGYNPTLYNYERWTSPIYMPRWASRITLEVTGVRVERLKDISEKDAEAEGCPLDRLLARDWYSQLWESINGPGSWSANPWVWVIEFARIDAQQAAA